MFDPNDETEAPVPGADVGDEVIEDAPDAEAGTEVEDAEEAEDEG